MASSERTAVVGAFEQRRDAEQAVEELHRAGFGDDQIGFATRGGDEVEGGTAIEETGSHAGSGAAGGLLTGGVIGGILGALAAGLIPGIGPVIAGGILAGVLGGAAVGAAAGGLLGALVGMGVPEDEAEHYNREFESGRTIVTVKADGRSDEARAILQRYGVLEYGGQPATGAAPAMARGEGREARRTAAAGSAGTGRERTVELREEELRARKQPVEAGEVEIGKEVVTEEKSIEVPVSREEVVIERHPVDRRPSDRPIAEGETIDVPVREERVEVEKRPVVYEEVEVGKRQVQETQRVSDTVRREEVRLEREGDVDVRGAGAERAATAGVRAWSQVSPTYRQSWERRHGTSAGRWEDVEPAYRYAHEMRGDPRYRGRAWTEVESDLRSGYADWGRRQGQRADANAWERLKANVREAWEEARD